MDITSFLATFWGSLFMILGGLSITARFLSRVAGYAKDRTITVSTGYITMILGLLTVVAHNVWVWNWPVVVTVLGWVTLFKGIEKVGLPDRVSRKAQTFGRQPVVWGTVIFMLGAFLVWIGSK